jgi:hypothetical protein
MEPSGSNELSNELSDRELDRLLQEWKAPLAPARLRGKVFGGWGGSWRRFWNISIRIPLPVACCLAILLALAAWRWSAKPAEEVPKFHPVRELLPRIIKVAENAE